MLACTCVARLNHVTPGLALIMVAGCGARTTPTPPARDRIAIVDHGELKALDSPMKLKASIPGKNVLDVSFSSVPPAWAATLQALPHVESVTEHDDVFRISSGNGPATTLALMEAAAAANVSIASLSVQSTSLDDVFVHYTGRALRDALQEANPLDRGPMLRRA